MKRIKYNLRCNRCKHFVKSFKSDIGELYRCKHCGHIGHIKEEWENEGRKIKLPKGQVALVDEENYDYLNQFQWKLYKKFKKGLYYAFRYVYAVNIHGELYRTKLFMHQVVMNTPKGKHTHHHGNTLDNRKKNLKVMSRNNHFKLHNEYVMDRSWMQGLTTSIQDIYQKHDKKELEGCWDALLNMHKIKIIPIAGWMENSKLELW